MEWLSGALAEASGSWKEGGSGELWGTPDPYHG